MTTVEGLAVTVTVFVVVSAGDALELIGAEFTCTADKDATGALTSEDDWSPLLTKALSASAKWVKDAA